MRISTPKIVLFVLVLVLLCGLAAAQETLYGSAYQGNGGAATLYEIDPSTGAPILIGPIGFNSVGAMDFHPTTGVLYGVGQRPADGVDVLITIDPIGGAGTEVGPLVNTVPGVGHWDLSFRSDGTLFLDTFDGATGFCSLFEVDLGSGLATLVGRGVQLNAENRRGMTPLALSLERPQLASCAEFLARHGAALCRADVGPRRFH